MISDMTSFVTLTLGAKTHTGTGYLNAVTSMRFRRGTPHNHNFNDNMVVANNPLIHCNNWLAMIQTGTIISRLDLSPGSGFTTR